MMVSQYGVIQLSDTIGMKVRFRVLNHIFHLEGPRIQPSNANQITKNLLRAVILGTLLQGAHLCLKVFLHFTDFTFS
jgi:hypothetical protein